jgi:transcription elongation factor Elf1
MNGNVMSEWIDRKYAGIVSNRLDRFQVKSNQPYTANFRCPICGDSQKSKWKARGYFFSKKGGIFYKCHNCSFSGNLNSFLKNVDPALHKQYVFETFSEGKQPNTAPTPFDFSQPKFKPKTILDDLFVPVKGTPAEDYLRSRLIPEKVWPSLYYVDDSQKLEDLSAKYKDRVLGSDPRLVIPFYDLEDNLVAVNCRAINDCRLRYITVKIDDDAPMIYNLNKVDRNRTVYVTEGPIDSMFLDNSVAVGSSDLNAVSKVLDRDNVVLVFDNQPRNKQLVQTMEQAADQYKMVIWPSSILQKDINEMVESGVDNIQHIIDNNTLHGLALSVRLNQWKKV